jgi:hypothetical protein
VEAPGSGWPAATAAALARRAATGAEMLVGSSPALKAMMVGRFGSESHPRNVASLVMPDSYPAMSQLGSPRQAENLSR